MALRRSARAGTTITLRSRVLDDLDEPAQASGVAVYLFEPDVDYTDLTNAIDSGAPTYWDEGIFQYSYAIPDDATDGVYTDLWVCTLNSQTISGVFTFEVSASGVWQELKGQLNQNNFVDVIVHSGIMSTSGAALETDFTSSFLTEVNPAYTEANKVRLEIGSAISDVDDDALYLAILEASLEADQLTFNSSDLNGDFFKHARREWTTCRAAATLSTNARTGFYAKSKRLGDMSIDYDIGALDDLMDRIAACLRRWETQLRSGGYGTRTPKGVIKGEYDPDRPNVGRVWFSSDEGNYVTRKVPAANYSGRLTGKRRWQKGYKGRWS